MKGFIELTNMKNSKILFNIDHIECVFIDGDSTKIGTITDAYSIYTVKETYDEVKQKIKEAMEQKIWEPAIYPQTPYPKSVCPDTVPYNPSMCRDKTVASNVTLKEE